MYLSSIQYVLFMFTTVYSQSILPASDNACRKTSFCQQELDALTGVVRRQDQLMQSMKKEFSDRIALLEAKINDLVFECENPWIKFEGHCYYFSPVTSNWTSASTFCRNNGSHLVAVETTQENNFVGQIARNNSVTLWLDGSDTRNEGTWIWTSTGNSFSFTDWRAGDPDGGTGQNCLSLHKSFSYKWIDASCTNRFHFVCEKQKSNK